MPRKRWKSLFSGLLVVMLMALVGAVGGPPVAAVGIGDYAVATIPPLMPGGTHTNPKDINDEGLVVGDDAVTSQAIRWTSGGGTVALGLPPGMQSSTAYAVNDTGQIVGFMRLQASNDTRAFLYPPLNPADVLTDLGLLPGYTSAVATDINNAGQVVGTATNVAGGEQAFRWTQAAGLQALPNTLGGTNSGAAGLNEAGQIVGYADDADGIPHAVLWTGTGEVVALDPLYSFAAGINEAGEVAGVAYSDPGGWHVFRWTAATGPFDLGAPPNGYSIALTVNAINDLGQIGGYGFNGTDQRAFVWFPGSGYSDLVDLDGATSGFINGQVYGLNNRGQVVGYADNPDRGLLLTPNDTTPPVTTATPSGTSGAPGWYLSDVTVQLQANDAGDPSAFGVARISYSATGAQAIPLTNVSGASAAPVIVAEGETTLTYYATDNAGNVETAKVLTVRIDKTPPLLTTTASPTAAEPGEVVTLTVTADQALVGAPTVAVIGPCINTTILPTVAGSAPNTYTASYSVPAGTEPCTITVTPSGQDEAGNTATGGATTFASIGAPPVVLLAPATLDFGNRAVGTSSAPRQIVLTNTGGRPLAIADVALGGANPGDFSVAYTSCAGSLVKNQSCVIAITFAPAAAGARGGTLTISTDAAGSPHSVALVGTGVAPSAQVTLTLETSGGGTTTLTPPGTAFTATTQNYTVGTVVTLVPNPGSGQSFTGWTINGAPAGWAEPLTITMDESHAVRATFAPTTVFPDVPSERVDAEAILELTSRGVVRGYADGTYGPDNRIRREEMAALIARATPKSVADGAANLLTPPACAAAGTWDCEAWPEQTFPDLTQADPKLRRAIQALAHYAVARGYVNGTYGPKDDVTYAQTLSFITRAMIAKGYWTAQPGTPPANVPTEHAGDVTTFAFYTGSIPAPPAAWGAPATRGWFAQALWAALDSYWSNDGLLPDGHPAGGYQP